MVTFFIYSFFGKHTFSSSLIRGSIKFREINTFNNVFFIFI